MTPRKPSEKRAKYEAPSRHGGCYAVVSSLVSGLPWGLESDDGFIVAYCASKRFATRIARALNAERNAKR